MIRKNQRLLNIFNRVIDLCILFAVYMAVTYIRFDVMYGDTPKLGIAWNPSYFNAAILYSCMTVFIYQMMGLYDPMRVKPFFSEVSKVFWSNVLSVILLTAFLYVTRLVDFSRIAIFLFLIFGTVAILVKRYAVRRVLREARKRGYNLKHVIIVGNGRLAREYVASIQANPDFGYHIKGYVSLTEREGLGKLLGCYEDLDKLLKGPGTDEVVIALEPHETVHMPQIIHACDKHGTRTSIIPFFNDYTPNHLTVDLIGDCKLINVRTSPLDNVAYAMIKRVFDIVASFLLLILTSPVMLVAAIGIRITSPGPVIFKQRRVGLNKREFTMYKFRTMHLNTEENTGWTKPDDARKTGFGSFLRKTSIDEFPQFYNILRGHMSLVGPRPEIPHFVEQFRESIPLYMVKHQVRPGMTGWAQINGLRGDTSIEERVKYDIWYIENWSFALDVQIIFKTVFGGMVNKEKVGGEKPYRWPVHRSKAARVKKTAAKAETEKTADVKG